MEEIRHIIWFVGLCIVLVIILDRAGEAKTVLDATSGALSTFIKSLEPPAAAGGQ